MHTQMGKKFESFLLSIIIILVNKIWCWTFDLRLDVRLQDKKDIMT